MKESIFIACTIVLVYIFILLNRKSLKLVEYNGHKFMIQSKNTTENSVQLLGEIVQRLFILRNYLVENKNNIYNCCDCEKCLEDNNTCSTNECNNCNDCLSYLKNYLSLEDFKESVDLLKKNFNQNRTKFYENINDTRYTSYSVNKGEEMVFCLKARNINRNYHPIDLLMYVAIHELAHCGCKEIGHTRLYNKIFKVYLIIGIKLNLYNYVNYENSPVEYCGMKLSSNILN